MDLKDCIVISIRCITHFHIERVAVVEEAELSRLGHGQIDICAAFDYFVAQGSDVNARIGGA
jgi:hypothetical protein